MIFVTVGSQKFQFDRLLKKIDDLIESKEIDEELFAQIGASEYIPKNYSYERYLTRESFLFHTKECDLFITHGGTGAIIGALKAKKKVIAVPRLAKYGEHVDNHQIQLVDQFVALSYINSCYDIKELGEVIKSTKNINFKTYVSNTSNIIKSINQFIESSTGV
ncbi:PssE/Cps14G family polysaccharide biosynthesis glycosyltransferase [Atopococcus tabaci]|uniref:PssE/Cps14G family polysaccharide biosynthesis glycosyltransferase n=1 Tax=Atopococcus tabaci TaxID=269774 RepID=UPI000485C683|nr:PssE/Cps14G family polysaccharide biosynthesis glycosyltransferase [Atopococcus tabaci]